MISLRPHPKILAVLSQEPNLGRKCLVITALAWPHCCWTDTGEERDSAGVGDEAEADERARRIEEDLPAAPDGPSEHKTRSTLGMAPSDCSTGTR